MRARLRLGKSPGSRGADIKRRPKDGTLDSRSQSAKPSTTACGWPCSVAREGLPRAASFTIAEWLALASFKLTLRVPSRLRDELLHRIHLQPLGAAFVAVAGFLDAAEGRLGSGDHHVVDRHHAG